MEKTKCLVIGSGPAGYTAAIYASRANLSPVLIEGIQPGGQLTQTTVIENFPGFPQGITGPELMDNMRKQAVNVGADVRSGSVVDVDFETMPYKVTLDNGTEIEAETVIIATGAAAKYLGLSDEIKYQAGRAGRTDQRGAQRGNFHPVQRLLALCDPQAYPGRRKEHGSDPQP